MPFLGKFPTQIVDPEVDIDGGAIDGVTIGATTASTATVTTLTSGNITTTGYIAGPSTFTIDPAAVGDNTGTLVVAGNLQVDGTTTTINSTTMTVDDLNITLASGAANAAAANGAGITVDGASATLTYNSTPDAWSFNKNVGIGTVSPSELLHVNEASTNAARIRLSNADGYMELGTNNQVSNIDSQTHTFRNEAGSTEYMRIDSSGRVQIGTISPYNSYADNLVVEDDSNAGMTIATTDTTARTSLYFADGASVGADQYRGIIEYRHDSDKMYFWTNATDHNIVIDSSGNVGIGTDSPNTALQVSSAVTTKSVVETTGTSSDALIEFTKGQGSGNTWSMGIDHSNSSALSFAYLSNGSPSLTSHGKVTIDTSGKVGIGTASPDTLLHVSDTSPHIDIGPQGGNRGKIGYHNLDVYIGSTSSTGKIIFKNNIGSTDSPQTSGDTKMVITDTGVGIGTTSPSSILTVNKDTGSTPTVYINNSGPQATEGVALKVQASGRGVGVKDADVFSVHNNAGEIFTVRNDGYAEAAAGFAVPFKHFPDASFGAAGSSTGRIKIALPDTASDYDMVTIELTVYQYNDTAGSKILISGHNWSNNGWYNVSVQVIGKYNKPIKLARSTSDNKYYILLGDTTDSWSYVTVHVNEVTTAPFYNTVTDWTQGWSITQVSSDSTTYSAVSGDYNTTGSRTLRTNGYVNSSGIIFGSDTGGHNALDDYEEGTWTPSLASATTATIANSYGSWYRKIGSIVFYSLNIQLNTNTDTGSVQISIPFASSATSGERYGGAYENYVNSTIDIFWYQNQNSSYIAAYATSGGAITYQDLSGKYIQISGMYIPA